MDTSFQPCQTSNLIAVPFFLQPEITPRKPHPSSGIHCWVIHHLSTRPNTNGATKGTPPEFLYPSNHQCHHQTHPYVLPDEKCWPHSNVRLRKTRKFNTLTAPESTLTHQPERLAQGTPTIQTGRTPSNDK